VGDHSRQEPEESLKEAEGSWVTQRALERGVEILSEASRHIPEDVKARDPTIPWHQVKAIGNHIRHGYERVDLDVIWSVATESVDELKPVLRAMLVEIEGPPNEVT
jgi:uncharacterized protein with HEPN domain